MADEADSSAAPRPDSEESPREDPVPDAAAAAKEGAADAAPPANDDSWSASQPPSGSPRAQSILTIPVIAVPCILTLETPGFAEQFARTHQVVLATVTAQQHVQMQAAYHPSETPTPTSSQPVLPTVRSVPSQPMSPGTETNSGDVYNWRKYGQKQVKNTENSRSYYRCANSNCLAKKKVERSPDGKICEVIYNGKHEHDPPQKCRYTRERGNQLAGPSIENESSDHLSNLPNASDPSACKSEHNSGNEISEQQLLCSSDHERDARIKIERDDVEEPDPKRRLSENSKSSTTTREEISKSSTPFIDESSKSSRIPIDDSSKSCKTVREYIVQAEMNARNLSDGYRWRKYGQKFVKGNPNPRSYYRCTHEGCPVRKHVEKSSHDAKALLITYEGKHNHDQPTPKCASDQQLAIDSPAAATGKESTVFSSLSDKNLPKDSNFNDSVANLADDKASEVGGNEAPGCAQTLTGIKDSGDRTNPDGMRNPLLNENPAAVPVENS